MRVTDEHVLRDLVQNAIIILKGLDEVLLDPVYHEGVGNRFSVKVTIQQVARLLEEGLMGRDEWLKMKTKMRETVGDKLEDDLAKILLSPTPERYGTKKDIK